MPLVVTHPDAADATFSSRGETAWEANHTVSGSVSPDQGGTGISTYEIGDLLTASTTSGLARIAAVPTNQLLVSQGTSTQPQWSSAPSVSTFTIALGNLTVSTGQLQAANGTQFLPAYAFAARTSMGLFNSNNALAFVNNGTFGFQLDATGTFLQLIGAVLDLGGTADAILTRDAANIIAQRNGTNRQFLRVYGNHTATSTFTVISHTSTDGFVSTNVGNFFIGASTLVFTSSGTVYGTALHNNSASVSTSTLQYLASGTYTPTLSSIANLDDLTTFQAQWMRVGNVVNVTGKVQINPTLTATLTRLGFTLPIASSLSNEEDCAGTAFASGISGQGAAIRAEPTNDQAEMVWIASDITVQPMFYSYSYEIL